MQFDNRITDAFNILYSLFDIIPCEEQDTKIFKEIYHKDLCLALKFWIDQTKLFFGEVAQAEIIHGQNEAGIDIFVDLLKKPPIRFAIQVKSYSDIKAIEETFYDKVHAQINKSHKHNLSKIILAFAADMSETRLKNKISYILSDIHQNKGDNDFAYVINPMQLLTIWKTYKNGLNPLDYINFSIDNCIRLSHGLSKALSNDRRKAKVTINLEYMQEENKKNGLRIKFQHTFKKDKASIISRIENMPSHDEAIIIPPEEITEFNVYEGDKKIFSSKEGELVIKNTPQIKSISLQTFSDNKLLSSIENINLIHKFNNNAVSYNTLDDEESLRFLFEISDNKKIHLSFKIDNYRSDVVHLFDIFNFVNSFKNSTMFRLVNNTDNKNYDFPLPNKFKKETVDDELYKFVNILKYIQENTGYILKLPKSLSDISKGEFDNIYIVKNAIELGKIEKFNFTCVISLQRIQALNFLEDYNKGKKDFNLKCQLPSFNILGRTINLGPGTIISNNIKINGNKDQIYNNLINSSENADLEIKATGEFLLEWFKSNLK